MSCARRLRLRVWLRALVVGFALTGIASANPIVWTGPTTTFSKVGSADPNLAQNQDRLTDNAWITRGGAGSGGIYNVAAGEMFYDQQNDDSPLGTEWATELVGDNDGQVITATNFANLDFTTWARSYDGPGPLLLTNIFNIPAVVHLIDDDIYLNVQFTAFNNTGLVTYQRSTPGLTGDYSGNNQIDAADYTVWRDTVEASGTFLPNDPTPGTVNESDFEYWRDHFGETLSAGAGAAASAAVPEPAGLLLAVIAFATLHWGTPWHLRRRSPTA